MNKGFFYIAPVLLILAAGLLFLPSRSDKKELPPQALQLEINDASRFISTDEVADIIIQADPSYLLVDLRPEKDFLAYSLKGARNIPLEKILDPENMSLFAAHPGFVVFFGNGDVKAGQAWQLLSRKGLRKLLILKGGLNAWVYTILRPQAPPAAASQSEQERYHRRLAASEYFVGPKTLPAAASREADKPAPRKVEPKPLTPQQPAEGGC